MRKSCILLFLMLLTLSGFAQPVVQGITASLPPAAPKKKLFLQAGYTYAVINNRLEVRGLYKPGVHAAVAYSPKPWFIWETGANYFFRHESLSLADIDSWQAESNGLLVMRVGQSDLYFRTVFGLSYTSWKGTYVGPNLNDQRGYYYGLRITENLFSGNLGCGFSHAIGKRWEGFGDFRLRFTPEEYVMLSITDTAFYFGLRYCLLEFSREDDPSGKANRKTKSGIKGRTYKWLNRR